MQNYVGRGVLLLITFWASCVAAQPADEGDVEDARAALLAGEDAAAVRIAQSVVDQDPNSFDALLILALAHLELEQTDDAIAAGTRAFRAARNDAQRVQAARLVAGAHTAERQFTRAEFWLRRAANNARSDAEAEAVVREYIAIVEENPLSLALTASVAPTDNINNGTETEIIDFEGVPDIFDGRVNESDRSLSGIGYSAGISLRYDLHESEKQSVFLRGNASGSTYTLSQEAKDLLASSPSETEQALDGNDFSTAVASLGLTMNDTKLSPLGQLTFRLDTGTYWDGGTRILDYKGIGLTQTVPVDNQSQWSFGIYLQDQTARIASIIGAEIQDHSVSYGYLFENRNRMQFGFTYRYSDAGFENIYDEYRFGLGGALAKPVFGTRLSGRLQIGTRSYDEFTTTLDGRRDRFASFTGNATLTQISYFGFSPGISISASRNYSTAEENTSSTFQVLFGIESSF